MVGQLEQVCTVCAAVWLLVCSSGSVDSLGDVQLNRHCDSCSLSVFALGQAQFSSLITITKAVTVPMTVASGSSSSSSSEQDKAK